MKKLYFTLLLVLSIACGVAWATLKTDIDDQGVESYLLKSLTSTNVVSMRRGASDLTAASTILSTACGDTYFLNAATEFATTLPAVEVGCSFRFIVKAAPAAASYTVITPGSANILIGGINELEVDTSSDGPYDNNGDTITFADGVAVVGDVVHMVSDGTSWYLSGQANADGGITVTGT